MNAPNEFKRGLAAAFVKAQQGFAPALKSSLNPHFKSKYVDLAGCVEAVIDSLNTNGIALMQNTHETDNGVIVETVFLHESGESLSCGKLHVPASKQDAQGYGSALTYARRYSLMAACGIAPEDDDGNAASKAAKGATKPSAGNPRAIAHAELSADDQAYLYDLGRELVTIYHETGEADAVVDHIEAQGLSNELRAGLEIFLAGAKTDEGKKMSGAVKKLERERYAAKVAAAKTTNLAEAM